MRGNSGLLERSAAHYLPYIGHHPTATTVLLEDGSLLAMGRLRGVPHELAAASERNAAAKFLNSLWRQIADDTITLGIHLVRFRKTDQLPTPVFGNDFARRFDQAYRQHILDEVFENAWFLSLVISPRLPMGNQKQSGREWARLVAHFRKTKVANDPYRLAALEDLWMSITRTLEGYNVRRLGVRESGGLLFSEIAEALRLILYCQYLPVGLTDGPLGSAIYTDRAVFERRHYRLLHPGGVRYGAIFGLREYMSATRPGMFDALLPLRMPLVLSQSFGYLPRQLAIQRLTRKQNQMVGSSDRAYAQIADIDNALSEVAGSEVARGMHHLSLAVYAETYPGLEMNAGEAQSALSTSGSVISQESLGIEAAFFAQLPGNLDWRTRPGVISTRNLAHFADFGTFPEGGSEGRWGPAIMRFRTVGHTAYDYLPHAGDSGDVGMTLISGVTGSGKTTWLMSVLAMFDQSLGEDGVIFFFDRDRGGELLVRAVGGNYLEIRAGEPSGLAPLRGLQNTPADREFLERWVKALITLDGHGPLPPQDDARISRGIRAIMRMPPELRSLEGLREFLGRRDQHGAGPRIERWCRGTALGWAFDGEEDEITITPRMMAGTRMFGFDLTSIFDNDEVIAPAAQYLLHRIGGVIDGRRAVVSLDECQAYMPHERFREMTDNFIRRGRKNNTVVFLGTQHPEDLMVGNFGTVIIEDVLTKIFFRNDTASEEVYRGQLKLTEGEYRAITEQILPGSRQCLLKRPNGSVIIDFDLSPMREFVAVLSGRANTVRYGERLREQSPTNWVDIFMQTYATAAVD
jgi:type IV secretion system protein VirB4